MKKIMTLVGHSRQVFRFLNLIAQAHGEKTLKDLLDFDEQGRLQELEGRGE